MLQTIPELKIPFETVGSYYETDSHLGFTKIGNFYGTLPDYNLWGHVPFREFILHIGKLRLEIEVFPEYRDEVFSGVIALFDGSYRVSLCRCAGSLNFEVIAQTPAEVPYFDEPRESLEYASKKPRYIYLLYMLQSALMAIHAGCSAKLCVITDSQKIVNLRRISKGKRPILVEKTILIQPSIYYKVRNSAKDRKITCAHKRRGHYRILKSGKTVWVRDCQVAEGVGRNSINTYIFGYSEIVN